MGLLSGMPAATFFLRLNIQFENLGDVLINRELIKLVGQFGRVIIDEGNCPIYLRTLLRTIPLPDVEFVASRHAFLWALTREQLSRRSCFYVMCPGGMGGELGIVGFAKRLAQLPVIAAMRIMGLRFIQVGASYDTLGSRFATFLRLRAPMLSAHHVRDEWSVGHLQSWKISVDGLLPDLAFNMFEKPASAPGPIHTICLSFRTDQSSTQLERIQHFIDQLVALVPPQTTICLLAQVYRDVAGMKALQTWLEVRTQRRAVLLVNCENIEQNLDFLRNCDVVFSNRLHVLLLGAAACGRMVACVDEQQPKIEGLFHTLQLGAAILRMDTPLTESAVREAITMVVDGMRERERLRQGFQRLLCG